MLRSALCQSERVYDFAQQPTSAPRELIVLTFMMPNGLLLGSRLGGNGNDFAGPVLLVRWASRCSSKNMETLWRLVMKVRDVARKRAMSTGRAGKVAGSRSGMEKVVHGSEAALSAVGSVPRLAKSWNEGLPAEDEVVVVYAGTDLILVILPIKGHPLIARGDERFIRHAEQGVEAHAKRPYLLLILPHGISRT